MKLGKMEKAFLSIALAAGMAGGLAACNEIDGSLSVTRELRIANNTNDDDLDFCRRHPKDYYCRGVDTSTGTAVIAPGQYQASLNFPSEKELILKVEKSSADQKSPTSIHFAIPKDAKLPSYSGDVKLTAEQVGKPFDISGTVDTQESDTSDTSTIESCTITIQHELCEWVHDRDRNGHDNSHRECHTDYDTIYGRQEVTYHYHDSTKTVDLSLLTPKTTDTVARFTGSSSDSDKVYTYQGPCYP